MTTKKVERRIKIKYRIRKRVNGTAERPRLSVFRSNKQIYAQVINDLTGTTLASASSLGLEKMPKIQQAAKVGEMVAANDNWNLVTQQTAEWNAEKAQQIVQSVIDSGDDFNRFLQVSLISSTTAQAQIGRS